MLSHDDATPKARRAFWDEIHALAAEGIAARVVSILGLVFGLVQYQQLKEEVVEPRLARVPGVRHARRR